MSEAPLRHKQLVKAIFNFQPTNTDELSFQKGDVITVTQSIEGGWWEGTLRGVTGWFPSNYVQDVKGSADGRSGAKSPRCKSPDSNKVVKRDSSVVSSVVNNTGAANGNHLVVLQELIGNEKKFVCLVEELVGTYLRPLETNSFLTADEYSDVYSNLDEISNLHQSLLSLLEEAFKVPVAQQRFGRIFLEMAPKFQSCYYRYSANHPRAAFVLQSKREDFSKYMEGLGAPTPGTMTLTTRLSKPFQQIERYSNLLKELERHSEETHVDRGDNQRAISVYRDIALSCMETRRQKEMEFDILHGDIKGWEGDDISQLGEVLMLSHVWVQVDSGERKERYMLLFSDCLVLFSITARVSGYVFEGKMNICNATVSNLDENDKPAFEITGGTGIERLVVMCISSQEKTKWFTHLRPLVKVMPAVVVVAKPQNLQVSTSHTPSVNSTPAKSIAVTSSQVINSSTFCKSVAVTSAAIVLNNKWNVSCLRPCPPLRPSTFVKDDGTRSPRAGRRILGSGRRKLVDDAKVLEEDAVILRVIEAYCTSAKVRQTVNSSLLENPQVLIAEEEKIIVEETKGDQTVVEEKTLVDTVYSLKDQVRELRQEQQRLRRDLDNEKKARKRLESLLRNSLKNIVENTVEGHDTNTATGVANVAST